MWVTNKVVYGWENFWTTFSQKSFSEVLKETLFVIIPVVAVFAVTFGIAYYQKKKSGIC